MRKVTGWLIFVTILMLLGSCEKNNCQTYLQGSWKLSQSTDSLLALDSVIFYKGDSLTEFYRRKTMPDTVFIRYHSSYFISDNCDEIDFNGNNTWDSSGVSYAFGILQITTSNFEMRSKKASDTCQRCIYTFHR